MSGGRPVDVYTDGSCIRNGQPGAQAGAGVWWGSDHPLNRSMPVEGRATNNRGEIEAARQAIRDAGQASVPHLRINTDSDFLKKSVEQWMPRWRENGYTKANGEPVINREDFQALDREMNNYPNMKTEFRHVPGHSGNRGNECADRLAKDGARQNNRRY